MKTSSGLLNEIDSEQLTNANLIFCAYDRVASFEEYARALNDKFPNSQIVGFTTAGHFFNETIHDSEAIYSAIQLEQSEVVCQSFNLNDFDSSEHLGVQIGRAFEKIEHLKGLTIISDGSVIDGTDLMRGINARINSSIPVFGGMAGDQGRFEETHVGLNEMPKPGNTVAIGFVGDRIQVKAACQDGWSKMGMEFTITKSEGNILYELDNENAYNTLYRLLESQNEEEFAVNTIRYPFQLSTAEKNDIIRTPLAIDHENKVITYAGHMPQGQNVSLMKATAMDLLDCASGASEKIDPKKEENAFAMAISCLGRRAVLDDLANEEYAEVKGVFGEKTNVFGFYSYGEYSRLNNENNHCLLHNQTFTVALVTE